MKDLTDPRATSEVALLEPARARRFQTRAARPAAAGAAVQAFGLCESGEGFLEEALVAVSGPAIPGAEALARLFCRREDLREAMALIRWPHEAAPRLFLVVPRAEGGCDAQPIGVPSAHELFDREFSRQRDELVDYGLR